MKKSLIFILIVSFLVNFSADAQKRKIRFHSINQFAMVGGENQVNTAFQTVNGIRFSDWFTGIGIGVDYYRYKTLPLFYDARWYFGDQKKAFIYGDAGYNFPLKNKPEKEISYYSNSTYLFNGGYYFDFGTGYQFALNKKISMLFSLGYSYKKVESKIEVTNYCPFIGPCSPNYYKYDYSFNRMILKAGLVF